MVKFAAYIKRPEAKSVSFRETFPPDPLTAPGGLDSAGGAASKPLL